VDIPLDKLDMKISCWIGMDNQFGYAWRMHWIRVDITLDKIGYAHGYSVGYAWISKWISIWISKWIRYLSVEVIRSFRI
jgi:hypothetical protein